LGARGKIEFWGEAVYAWERGSFSESLPVMRAAWHFLRKGCNFHRILTGAFAGMLMAGSVAAQEAGPDEGFAALEQRRAQLFQATLNDPANLDIAFEYALLSARLGDYEGAISTLERILVFNPGLPRVQLELAVLYYRIGAVDTAQHYLDAVRGQD
ncbi:tetratricopeptide repeat protein, partial [Cribrihabitans sp. XS_ASV171]